MYFGHFAQIAAIIYKKLYNIDKFIKRDVITIITFFLLIKYYEAYDSKFI